MGISEGAILKAKRKEVKRFYTLYDKVYWWYVLVESWRRVCSNKGCAGIDDKTIEDIVQMGVEEFLKGIQRELKEKVYRSDKVKRVYISKPDKTKRPLGIPTVKDRVAQMAVKIVIEPIFEAEFQDCLYGFRPKRSAHEALKIIKRLLNRGYRYVCS